MQYRVYSRNNTQKLGANGRDEPANISTLCAPGGSCDLLLETWDKAVGRAACLSRFQTRGELIM